MRLESRVLGRELPYRVHLPPGYVRGSRTYPLLLLLHGSGGDEESWAPGLELLDELVRAGDVPPMIAVAPASGTSWWVDGVEAFETTIIRELLPEVEARYHPFDGQARGWGVVGFSMGGYGAVRYALNYPHLFRAAAALSSALYDGEPPPGSSARSNGAFGEPFDGERWHRLNYPALLEAYWRQDERVPIFIAAGDDDWNEPAGWTYNTEYQSLLLFERLQKEGGSPAQLRISGGGHDWSFWRQVLPEALRYVSSHFHTGPIPPR